MRAARAARTPASTSASVMPLWVAGSDWSRVRPAVGGERGGKVEGLGFGRKLRAPPSSLLLFLLTFARKRTAQGLVGQHHHQQQCGGTQAAGLLCVGEEGGSESSSMGAGHRALSPAHDLSRACVHPSRV